MEFNAICNNISVISWRSVLLTDELGENLHVASHWQALSHNVLSSTPRCGWLFSPRKNIFSWSSPHMKAVIVLLYRNYSKKFKAWMFCFVEDHIIISGIVNTTTEPDKAKQMFKEYFWLSGFVDKATTYCLPLHYICLDCPVA